MYEDSRRAKLVLEDGTIFSGFSFGSETPASGEVVFNTGMVGYPETLTDPSYRGQIITFTYPEIGNYGVPGKQKENGLLKNFESEKIQASGLIVSNYSKQYNHSEAKQSLSEWLCEEKIPALYGIDTRALTKKLREKGVMLGKIEFSKKIKFDDPNKRNLAAEASVKEPIVYHTEKSRGKVLLLDCGTKNNIVRSLLARNLEVVRAPWDFDAFNSGIDFDGVLVSNGPGDPKKCIATIESVKKAMSKKIPAFGICLGNQILALAAGADTYKMKFGHRGQNQPCIEAKTKRCYITSQNHGYAVKASSLRGKWREWFVNGNDETNEGIMHESGLFFGTQFHPEASPGPTDTAFVFDLFAKKMRRRKK